MFYSKIKVMYEILYEWRIDGMNGNFDFHHTGWKGFGVFYFSYITCINVRLTLALYQSKGKKSQFVTNRSVLKN